MAEGKDQSVDSASSGELFAQRMEDQCQQVERYRQKIKQSEGRQLSRDEAALEWIENYASEYAQDGSCGGEESTG
jgi:DNA-binding protein H-NS